MSAITIQQSLGFKELLSANLYIILRSKILKTIMLIPLVGSEIAKPWREFIKYRETGSFFLLYLSNYSAHVISKRAFENETEIGSFRDLLKEKAVV